MYEWMADVFCASVSKQMSTFLHFLPLSKALSLSLTLAKQNRASKKMFFKLTAYPMLMFVISLFGVQIFCLLCMPSLIEMMKGFQVSTLMIEIMYHSLMIVSLVLTVLIMCLACVCAWAVSKKRIVMSTVLLYRLKLGFLIEKELSLHFARLYFECMRLGIPTKTALRMLQQCKDDPLTVFLAWHVEQVLLQGGNIQQAMAIEYLDPSLEKLMKTAVLSGGAMALLEGYLEISLRKKEKRMSRAARIIQAAAYSFAAVMIILVYQVLFLPLSMLERM